LNECSVSTDDSTESLLSTPYRTEMNEWMKEIIIIKWWSERERLSVTRENGSLIQWLLTNEFEKRTFRREWKEKEGFTSYTSSLKILLLLIIRPQSLLLFLDSPSLTIWQSDSSRSAVQILCQSLSLDAWNLLLVNCRLTKHRWWATSLKCQLHCIVCRFSE
jgi:hypothetical protein